MVFLIAKDGIKLYETKSIKTAYKYASYNYEVLVYQNQNYIGYINRYRQLKKDK